ncbi:MAG: zinc finger domain-containing protein [archaeon]|nr:zinc finger domain-containing protein [archaeon]
MKTCTTCNSVISGKFVEFKCPQCGQASIVRCSHCRTTSKSYSCPECSFGGP